MDAKHVKQLYHRLIEAWNKRDALAFADCFGDYSICIGFDGSEMIGKSTIHEQLQQVFKDHKTATYITIVREVKMLEGSVFLLRSHAGMIQPRKVKNRTCGKRGSAHDCHGTRWCSADLFISEHARTISRQTGNAKTIDSRTSNHSRQE